MKFSICIDAVFEGQDPVESLRAVQTVGGQHFEFWGWWDKDIDAIRRAREELGLRTAALCTRFISLVDPARRESYMAGLEETIEVARCLDCRHIISQVGDEREGVSRDEQHQCLVDGLKACAPRLERAGMTLVFEPLNTLYDHPGYYLYQSAEAFDVVREVGSERVKVIFDIYHQQIMEGNLINNITQNIELIGHFHAAGHPGRHEPDRGEINYPEVLAAIERTAYEGCVGLEYFPLEPPEDWLARFLRGARPAA